MRLYPGHLLIGEAEHPWMLPRRARLAGRFARCVRALGERLVHAGLREPAIRLYGHAIEVDPSDEEIYRRLIRLMIEDGSVPDALRVYTQCQTNLAALRGASPSRDTQSLIAPIRRPS